MSAGNLDARLLRFRLDSRSEDASTLASELLTAERAGEALEVVGVHLGTQPKDVDAMVIAGRAWMARGDLLRAQKTLLQAARIDAGHPDPYRWLGEVLLRRGDPDRAQKVLARARALGAMDPEVQRLHERATRLAKLAQDAGGGGVDDDDDDLTTSERPAPPPERPRGPEPATVKAPVPEPRVPRPAPVPASEAQTVARAPVPEPRVPPKPAVPPRKAPVFGSKAVPPPKAAPPRAFVDDDEDDESTVVASDLSAKIAAAVRREDDLSTEAIDDDAPTSMLDRQGLEEVQAALAAKKKAPSPFGADPFGEEEGPTRSVVGKGTNPFDDEPPTRVRKASEPPVVRPAPEPLAAPPRSMTPMLDSADLESADSSMAELASDDLAAVATPSPAFLDAASDDLASMDSDGAWAAGEPPARVRDVSGGERAGRSEDVDAILTMLQKERLFEPPDEDAASVVWAAKKDAPKSGTKVAVPLAVLGVLVVGLSVGGWFGYQWWVGEQDREAATLVTEATELSARGTHEALVDAERILRQARELSPTNDDVPRTLLFVHTQRALEDGAFEPGFLQPTVDRAMRAELTGPRVDVASAIVAFARGDGEEGERKLTAATEGASDDPTVLYAVGRLEQRLGRDAATGHLEAAAASDAGLASAAIALAEGSTDAGQPEEALARLQALLERHPDHLRATLWVGYLQATDEEPEPALARVDGLAERLERGAPADHVLHALTRAQLLRRLGRSEEARAALATASSAGATEPRLQALLASAAQSLGDLARAQQAAMAAVASAPAIAEYRKLLAEILVARRDGVRALRTLAQLSADDPEVLALSARAGLIVGTEEALQATAQALDAYLEANEEDASVEMRSLRIRVGVRLGHAQEMLGLARRLSRDAPGDPEVGLAVAEAALEARDARLATETLERVVQASPDDAEAQFLLGRARRMGGDGEGAETALRRAIELQPTHGEAQVLLGYLLLDLGRYAEADTLYQELGSRVGQSGSGRSYSLVGRLGRIEALLGLGRNDDARVQAESLRDADREATGTKLVLARLALAQNRPGEALPILRPLATEETASPDVVALYGDALYAAGETASAAETYERALASDGSHPESLLGHATVLVRGEKWRDAAEVITRIKASLDTRIRPPSLGARALTLSGRIALERGERDLALRELRAATEIETAPAEAWFYLGEALAGRDSPDARAAYETYLERAPAGPLAARARRAIR
ncbi:MAG: tetratricopeptide repeat protein [Sandaracinus sp.]|nr:tetratricopeptide repeat protein [Sandaracinus sp.]